MVAAADITARCSHGTLAGQPCKPCLVQRADRLAEWDQGLRHMLREVRGSRFQTQDFLGSSRAPSFRELLDEVERIEEGGLR